METGQWKMWVQAAVRRLGYQLSKLEQGVEVGNADTEQARLLKGEVNVIFEVGAADGRDSLNYVNHFKSATVWAFEPMPESFAKLAHHALSNPRIHPHQMAMSETEGEAEFFVAEWDDSSSLLKAAITGSTFDAYHKTKRSISVQVTTIDSFCVKESIDQIDLLKIDAQGAELMILRGATNILSNGGIRVIYCEIQFMRLYEGAARFDEIWSHLSKFGYRLHNIYDIVHNHRGEICWGDAIFIRDNKHHK
jgi:FkbM family methyltransferase